MLGVLAGVVSMAEAACKEKISEQSIGRWRADFLSTPRARTMGRPHTKVLRPMSKLCRDRSVWAPQ